MTGKSSLVNTNKLVRNYSGCTGLKTGSTSLALYNLSASATRNGMDLIAVVMKAPTSKDRFKIASTLLDYGFNNFEYKKLISKNDIVNTVKVNKGLSPSIDVIAEKDCGILLPKGKDIEIKQIISLPDTIVAPIFQNQVVGTVTYMLDDTTLEECNLFANSTIQKINIFSMSKTILNQWSTLLR